MQHCFEVVLDCPFNRRVLVIAGDVVEAGNKVVTAFKKKGYNQIENWIIEINRLKHEIIE